MLKSLLIHSVFKHPMNDFVIIFHDDYVLDVLFYMSP